MTAKSQTKKSETSKTIGFTEALGELEGILGKIESDEIDIDELATELKRATSLLEICRSKVRKAEAEVNQIVQGLSTDPAEADDE